MQGRTGMRALKKRVGKWLRDGDLRALPGELDRVPPRRLVNPLFSFLCSCDAELKMRAVRAMGEVTARMAEEDMESARVIMRRLVWQLNDESGGIGWGCPEAMGEIMARHEGLAREYASILVSFAREDGNLLEHEPLLRGVIQAIGRVAEVYPRLVMDAEQSLRDFADGPQRTLKEPARQALEILREAKGGQEGDGKA